MIIVGLISGTSADGVDVALCDVSRDEGKMSVSVIAAQTFPFPKMMQRRILTACRPHEAPVNEIAQLNFDLAETFAQATLDLLKSANHTPEQVDLIGCAGQTIWHNVLPGGKVSSTFQLVEASVIAERTGITTVDNFRTRDVAVGGQGAPLVSYVDWLLLRDETKWRAVQNIGGIGNVTFLPPHSSEATPLSFDTGPGNALIDGLVSLISNGEKAYDASGTIANSGHVESTWIESLLEHPYYEQPLPKTTGREIFGVQMSQALLDEGRARGLRDADIVSTVTALTSFSIADAYQRYLPRHPDEIIIGGGGAWNPFMLNALQNLLPDCTVLRHEDIGMDSDSKEALSFAVLAHETWHGRQGMLPSLTGAKKATVLGQISPGENYLPLLRQTLCSIES